MSPSAEGRRAISAVNNQRRYEAVSSLDTPTKKQQFLLALALGASVKAAAEHANVDRSTPYLWRHTDPAFAASWLKARASRLEELEEAAFTLALEGNGGNGPMLRFLISRHDAARASERPRQAVRQVAILPTAPAQADGVGAPLVGAQTNQPQEFFTVEYANSELSEMPSEIPQDQAGEAKSATVPVP